MNMESFSNALGEHYRHLRELIAGMGEAVQAGEWANCSERATALNDLLGRQIGFEETEVFPVVFGETVTNTGMNDRLRTEHEDLRNLATLLGMSSPAHDPSGWRAVLTELSGLMRTHIESESDAFLANAGTIPADTMRQWNLRLTELAPKPVVHDGYFVDVSRMEPPGPFVTIMDELARGHVPLRVRIHREPWPLYTALADQGYTHATRMLDDGCFEILIRRGADGTGIA